MTKKKVGIFILLIAVLAIFLLKNTMSIDLSIENLKEFINNNPLSTIIFLALWILRLVLLIPGVTLTVLGGLVFAPIEAFVLSMVGLVISDSIMFVLGRTPLFSKKREEIKEKNLELFKLIDMYNYKFLAIGVMCPIAPTDLICYLSSYLGLPYRKYILTFILANIPAVTMYSLIGQSFENSIYNTIFLVATLALTGILTIKIWNKMRKSVDTTYE